MASTYLYRTNGTSTNAYKGTVSHWIKRSGLGAMGTFAAWDNGGTSSVRGYLNMHNDTIYFYDEPTSTIVQTNRVFRDTSAWYHIVVAWDTSQSTASDRVKIYVNGVQETSMATGNYPAQNTTLQFNTSGRRFGVGCFANSAAAAGFFDGSMSHFHFCDGYTYTASDFGSTDSTTGEWKINTSPSVSYGNNGFFILKDGNSVTDQSGQGNNLTVGGGTLTKTEDCPSNVFATINPLDNFYNNLTITNGNTSWVSGSNYSVTRSTLGASSGKYYFEMKVVNEGNTDYEFGIVGAAPTSISSWMGSSGSYGYSYESRAELRANGTTVDPWGSTYDDGDILGCAFDLDNNKIYFSKNGSWQESGDPSSGSNGYTIIAAANTPAGAYFVGAGDFSGSAGQSGQFNFGNGKFGTTSVSSAGTNASGNGIFEYDVPTGYTALSTKGLNL